MRNTLCLCLHELMQKWPNICNNCRTYVCDRLFHCFKKKKNRNSFDVRNMNAWDWNFVAKENTLYSTERKSRFEKRGERPENSSNHIIYVIWMMKSFGFDAFEISNAPATFTNRWRRTERQECIFTALHSIYFADLFEIFMIACNSAILIFNLSEYKMHAKCKDFSTIVFPSFNLFSFALCTIHPFISLSLRFSVYVCCALSIQKLKLVCWCSQTANEPQSVSENLTKRNENKERKKKIFSDYYITCTMYNVHHILVVGYADSSTENPK